MIKACKWCGKEQEMRGRREFCPGERCKNAYKYAKRTGKLEGGKRVNISIPSPPVKRPQGLNKVAAAYWDKVAPTVIARGHLNVLSEAAFAELCILHSKLIACNIQIDKKSDADLLRDKLKYSKQFLDYCRAFYLTPLSNRGDFGLPEDKPKEDENERFFK